MDDAVEREVIGVLAAFLAQYNEDVAGGGARSLSEYQARFPGYEEVIAREYAELEGDEVAEEGAEDAIGGGRRYRVEDEVARGGMGVVYRIWDHDLRRVLAMKRLRTDRGSIPDQALARFLEEARVTAQLHHPGIVPVHDLGIDDSGRVYFTMDLVRGRGFDEIIELVARGDPEWTRPRALGVVQRICEAVAYAHSKGVVHRDLKPANVMVGRFGEVYVMDWGLARAAETVATRPGLGEEVDEGPGASIVVSSRAESSTGSWTIDGEVVGTPAYMAPEQARGRLEDVGPPADVYAIGAILYHLLSGRMPYVDPSQPTTSRELVDQVLSGSPRPLREMAPGMPPELVAICEKAMAREPGDRYADVRELGADVRAFLESRVVRAYRSGAFAEARKWVQRNRLAAAGLLLAGVGLVGGLAVSLLEKTRADEQAARAHVSAQDAMDAVEKMVARVGYSELKHVPQAQPIRRKLLSDAVEFYEKFLHDRGDDPSVRAEIAKTTLRIGLVRHDLGELEQAEGDGESAIEKLREAIARSEDTTQQLSLRRLLGLAQDLVAICRMETGRLEEAEAPYRDALSTFAALIEDQPDERSHLVDHARISNNVSVLLSKAGRYEEALEQARSARVAREQLVARFGAEYVAEVADSLNQEAAVLFRLERTAESIATFRRAVTVYESAVEQAPDDRELRAGLAEACNNLGAVGVREGYPDWSLDAMQRAIELRRQLVVDYPSVPRLAASLALSLRTHAKQLRERGRVAEAVPLVDEAVANGRRAWDQTPDEVAVASQFDLVLAEAYRVARELRDHARLASFAAQLADAFPEDPGKLATAGARLARAFPLALDDPSLPADQREAIATEYGRRCVALMRRAIEAGYRDLARLEPTLAPLRMVPELDAALDELARGGR